MVSLEKLTFHAKQLEERYKIYGCEHKIDSEKSMSDSLHYLTVEECNTKIRTTTTTLLYEMSEEQRDLIVCMYSLHKAINKYNYEEKKRQNCHLFYGNGFDDREEKNRREEILEAILLEEITTEQQLFKNHSNEYEWNAYDYEEIKKEKMAERDDNLSGNKLIIIKLTLKVTIENNDQDNYKDKYEHISIEGYSSPHANNLIPSNSYRFFWLNAVENTGFALPSKILGEIISEVEWKKYLKYRAYRYMGYTHNGALEMTNKFYEEMRAQKLAEERRQAERELDEKIAKERRQARRKAREMMVNKVISLFKNKQ